MRGRWTMKRLLYLIVAGWSVFLSVPTQAMTANEVLDECSKRSTVDSFRMGVEVINIKAGKTLSKRYFWVSGRTDDKGTSMFLEFEEPEEARGMRFLFKYSNQAQGQAPKAFAYIPVTGSAIPMKVSASQDIGGTGMTADDFRGFVPPTGAEPRLLGREKISGRECYVIEMQLPQEKRKSRIWISVDQFLVVKNQKISDEGKLEREFSVVEFFTTKDGKLLPRKEEIYVPKDDATIVVEQQNGLYNIDIPDELFNPETFGVFQWKSPGVW